MEPPLHIGVIMARLRSNNISLIFSEDLYNIWREWASQIAYYLSRNAGNSLGPPEDFCETIFIASTSFIVILNLKVYLLMGV